MMIGENPITKLPDCITGMKSITVLHAKKMLLSQAEKDKLKKAMPIIQLD